MNLCKYKNILGEPGKGVHSFRIFGIAIIDVILTIIAAYLISYFYKFNFGYTLVALFLLGIFLHRIFCVKTTIDKLLFPNLPKRVRFRD
jgi:hypothetical protein